MGGTMKDKIDEILKNGAYTTNEEKAEAINSLIGTMMFPKDKFNEQTKQLNEANQELSSLKDLKTKYDSLSKEYNDFKISKMTDEEKAEAEKKTLEEERHTLKLKSNRIDVERILAKAGLNEDDYKDDIDTIVSEDTEKSIKLANFLEKDVQSNGEKVKQQTQVVLINNTPKPVVGSGATISNIDAYKSKLAEAVKSKDQVEQARLLRLIQEESNKKTI